MAFYTRSVAQSTNQKDSSSTHSLPELYNQYRVPSNKAGIHEFSFWGGYSFHSTNGVWGKTSGAELGVLGFRYNRKLLQFPKQYLLKYVIEMNLHVRYQFSDISQHIHEAFRTSYSSLSGFGMTPVGLQLNMRRNHRLQPFFKSSTGFMYLYDPFPNELGTRFNFTLEVGTGAEIKLTEHSFFTIGYKYLHMSNGQIGRINPGVDSNVFYGGITFF